MDTIIFEEASEFTDSQLEYMLSVKPLLGKHCRWMRGEWRPNDAEPMSKEDIMHRRLEGHNMHLFVREPDLLLDI